MTSYPLHQVYCTISCMCNFQVLSHGEGILKIVAMSLGTLGGTQQNVRSKSVQLVSVPECRHIHSISRSQWVHSLALFNYLLTY